MPTININLKEIGEDVQYRSITAEIVIDKEEYLLEFRDLDNEDYQADLDVINGFIGVWEMRAEAEGFHLEISEDVTQEEIELSAMIEDEDA